MLYLSFDEASRSAPLIEAKPDLDISAALIGLYIGLWLAHVSFSRSETAGYPPWRKWAFGAWVSVAMCIGFIWLGNRLSEFLSFRGENSLVQVTVGIIDKETTKSRRAFDRHTVTLVNPLNEQPFVVTTTSELHASIVPKAECATILIEQAPNGAARLAKPPDWHVVCAPTGRSV